MFRVSSCYYYEFPN